MYIINLNKSLFCHFISADAFLAEQQRFVWLKWFPASVESIG